MTGSQIHNNCAKNDLPWGKPGEKSFSDVFAERKICGLFALNSPHLGAGSSQVLNTPPAPFIFNGFEGTQQFAEGPMHFAGLGPLCHVEGLFSPTATV